MPEKTTPDPEARVTTQRPGTRPDENLSPGGPSEQPPKTVSSEKEQISVVVSDDSDPLEEVFAILQSRTGHDFSHYKRATIERRVKRRMNANQIKDISAYISFLQDNPDEANALYKDLLINVTAFFRDPEAFDALKAPLKELIGWKSSGGEVRAWVAGCATGKETYSVAILILECLEETKSRLQVQVYGTDIDQDALRVARGGLYPFAIAEEVGPGRLARFFSRDKNGYRIKKEVREKVVFAPQDFTQDPPFSRMDLICCRNLLIYLDSEIQKKLLPLLHYALALGGLLFLGPSETVSESSDIFSLLDRKWKIYRRRDVDIPPERLKFPTAFAPAWHEPAGSSAAEKARSRIPELTEKYFLDNYSPTFAVVDEKYRLIYVRGRTGKYLELASGQPSLSILEMAREGLRTDLSSALYRATAEKQKNVRDGVRVKTNGDFQTIRLTVSPIETAELPPGCLMVVFEEREQDGAPFGSRMARNGRRNAELEEQLRQTRENLQSIVEELEATNEELKSANEELQSNNEELQSSNEELDTSREELQSLNEELSTMNSELRDKNQLLAKANDDLSNFLDRTDIAIIFLDEKLRIRSFTPASCEVFKLRPVDIGRPLEEISSELAYNQVIQDAREVLHSLQNREKEVQTRDEHWYTMRILPYRTVQNTISGLVLSFLNINRQKQAANDLVGVNLQLKIALAEQKKAHLENLGLLEESKQRLNELQTLLDNASVAIWIARDPRCLSITGNNYANSLFGVEAGGNISRSATPSDAAVAYRVFSGGRELKPEELPAQAAATSGKAITPYEMELVFEDGRRIDMIIGATPLFDEKGKVRGSVAIGTDLTERKKREETLRESEARFREMFEGHGAVMLLIEPLSGRIEDANPAAAAFYGYSRDALKKMNMFEINTLTPPEVREQMQHALNHQTLRPELPHRLATGEVRTVEVHSTPVNVNGRTLLFAIIHDITKRKRAQEALRASEERFRSVLENSVDVIYRVNLQTGQFEYISPSVEGLIGYSASELMAMGNQSIQAMVEPVDLTAMQAAMALAAKTGRAEVEYRQKTRSGEVRWISNRMSVNNDSAGKPLYRTSSVRDVTESRASEEALRETERSYRTLFENMIDGYANCRMIYESGQPIDFVYLAVNKAFEKLTGLKGVVGKKVSHVVPGISQTNPELFEIYGRVASGGPAERFEVFVEELKIWLSVSVYSTQKGTFTVVFENITERKLAEDALRQNEQRLRRFYESGLLGVIYWNMDGKVTDSNDKFLEMVGYTRQDLAAGRIDWMHMTPPEYRKLDEASSAELTKTGVNQTPFEKEYIRKDGTRIPIIVSGAMLDEQRFNGVAIVLDLTQRKKVEAELKESEEKYRGLFTNMTEGFALCRIITDSEVRPVDYFIVEVNQAWEEQTGLTGAEVAGRPIKEIIPNLEQCWVDNFGKVALSGEPMHFENYNQFTHHWYEIYAYSPRHGYFVTLVQNITERKRAEEALVLREERFRTLIENLHSGVALIDEEGKFVTVNSSFLRLFGLSEETSILNVNSQDWSAWQVFEEDGVTLLAVDEHPVRKSALTGLAVRNRLVGVKLPNGGELIWILINAEPILKPDGAVHYLIATYYDITERKKAEEAMLRYSSELEEHRHHLEEAVRQRTQELQSLSHRLIMVQEEERRNISRELHDQTGGSLTVLNLQLAKALRSPDTFRPDVQEALKSVREILSQVRTLSTSLHPGMLEDLGLASTLNWYISDFAKKTGIDIHFEQSGLEASLPPDININVYRIIQECLTNIARYAEVKEASVSLALENRRLKIRVEDAGVGFDPQVRSQGVGLRGMRERVISLNGEFRIISAPGKGTRIEVELPAVGAQADEAAGPA